MVCRDEMHFDLKLDLSFLFRSFLCCSFLYMSLPLFVILFSFHRCVLVVLAVFFVGLFDNVAMWTLQVLCSVRKLRSWFPDPAS